MQRPDQSNRTASNSLQPQPQRSLGSNHRSLLSSFKSPPLSRHLNSPIPPSKPSHPPADPIRSAPLFSSIHPPRGTNDGEGREQRVARQRQRPGGPRGRGSVGVLGEAGAGGCAWRGRAVCGAAAAVGAHGADDGRRPRGVGIPGGGQHLPVGRHHRRIRRHRVRGHLLPPRARLPQRLPLQAAQGAVRDPLLPPQRRQPRQHLPRHPPGQVVLRLRRPHHPPLHPEPARRAEQRLPSQHTGGRALGESRRVQEDGGEALQAGVKRNKKADLSDWRLHMGVA